MNFKKKIMKKVILSFAIILFSASLSGQSGDGYSTRAGSNTTFVDNGFWDNWFIGLGAGGNIYFGNEDDKASFEDRLTVTPIFQVGKWLTPTSGVRLKLAGGTNLYTFSDQAELKTQNKYVSAGLDYMINVTDYLLHYNANRVYNFIPYFGVGWAYGWDYSNLPVNDVVNYHDAHSASIDAGIINRFRFSKRVALDLEFSGKLLKDEFDQQTRGEYDYDILGTASANLIFSIGKTVTFAEAQPRSQSEIDALNKMINQQRTEIAHLSELSKQKEPEVIVKEVVKEVLVNEEPVNNVVLFAINKVKVEPHQEVNIYNVAKYLKENKGKKVKVIGYADSQTGTTAVNENLSRQRAQNVADIITNKYGIDSKRVIVEWKGDMKSPFDVTEWNRAVILYIE